MTWTRTIITGFVLLAMFALAFLDRKITENRIISAVIGGSLATEIQLKNVKEVRLRNPRGEAVIVREGENAWSLKSPVSAPADPESVETLLINVTGAKKNNEIEATSLADYGLAKPDTELTIVYTVPGTDASQKVEKNFQVLLGNESTYTGLVFAKYPKDKTVFTVGQHVKNVLQRAPLDFRRSRLFDVNVAELESYQTISIQPRAHQEGGANADVVLKNTGGKWRIVSPIQADAENDIVSEFLRKVGLLRAANFVNPDSDRPTSVAAALQALTSPSLVVMLERAGQKQPEGLSIATAQGLAGPVVVAQRQGDNELLVIRSETLDELKQTAHYFRSRNLFSLKPADVASFKIRIGHSVTDLIRNAQGRWEFKDDPTRKVDQESVDLRLEALLQAKVKEFIDANPSNAGDYGIGRFVFTVVNKDGSRTEALETGNVERGDVTHAYARRSGDPAIFTTEVSKDMIITPDQVADRRFARVDPRLVKRLEIEADGKKHTLLSEEGTWKIVREGQTAPASVDSRKAAKVFEQLATLAYTKDLSATGDTVITPPSEAPVRVKAFGEKDEILSDVLIGRRLNDKTYMRVNDKRTVETTNRDADALQNALRSLVL